MKYDIQILDTAFDPWQYLQAYQTQSMQNRADFGATATFVGTMRDFNEGDDIKSLYLEHYPAMTQKQLQQMVVECFEKWDLLNMLIVHRVGELLPTDPIVLVAVWSSHRAEAFDSCRYMMESLKHKAPFWKKETLLSGNIRWVEKNT